MDTKFIEVSNNEKNWGKFLLLRMTEAEWQQPSAITQRSLLREVGWNPTNIIVFDLQTGEGARFVPGGMERMIRMLKSKKLKPGFWIAPFWMFADAKSSARENSANVFHVKNADGKLEKYVKKTAMIWR